MTFLEMRVTVNVYEAYELNIIRHVRTVSKRACERN
jgi:hypothetical protein